MNIHVNVACAVDRDVNVVLSGGTRSMALGANASVEYIAQRITNVTSFVPVISTFVVARAKLLSPPQLSMVTPTPHSYKLNTDFSIRQGTGTVTQPLVYLADGGSDANIDSVTGKSALFKAIERPCGCVVVHGGTTFVRGSVEVCKTHVSPCV